MTDNNDRLMGTNPQADAAAANAPDTPAEKKINRAVSGESTDAEPDDLNVGEEAEDDVESADAD